MADCFISYVTYIGSTVLYYQRRSQVKGFKKLQCGVHFADCDFMSVMCSRCPPSTPTTLLTHSPTQTHTHTHTYAKGNFAYLPFIEPCIVIYFYSKTNQMHRCLKFILFGVTLYMFRTAFPSIIRSSRLYIQQQPFVRQILLSAC